MQLTVIIYFEIQVFWVNTDEYFQILLHLSHRCLQDYISLQKLISPVLSNGEIHYSKGNWISEQSKIFTTLLICFNSEFQLMIKRQRYFCSSSSIPHITLWWIYQLSFVVLNWLKKVFLVFFGSTSFQMHQGSDHTPIVQPGKRIVPLQTGRFSHRQDDKLLWCHILLVADS